jgi:organic hydroperoxide reductase OsmC/OhrA
MSDQDKDHDRHVYRVHCHWSGSTGAGYEHYDRMHTVSAPPATPTLELSADPSFRGDPTALSPEQLVVLAVASCQLLSFLAVAARAKIDVLGYDDEGEGVMPERDPPMRLTAITLRPTIRVAQGTSVERIAHLVEVAHRECYVSNSLRAAVNVEPTVIVVRHQPRD